MIFFYISGEIEIDDSGYPNYTLQRTYIMLGSFFIYPKRFISCYIFSEILGLGNENRREDCGDANYIWL